MTEATQPVEAPREGHASDSDPAALFRGKLWFWIPISPLVILDLWSKAAVFAHLASVQPTTEARFRMLELDVLPGPLRLGFVTWHNPGTIWYTASLAAGSDFEEAARLANVAAGLVVTKKGTATVTSGELLEAIRSG